MIFPFKRTLFGGFGHIIVLAMLLMCSHFSMANDFNSDHFEIYIGDINGDGVDDVYLAAKTVFVPIAGDLLIPLWAKVRSNYQLLSGKNRQYTHLTAVKDGVVNLGKLRLSLPLQWQDHDWNGHKDAQIPKQGSMPHAVVFMKGQPLTRSWRKPSTVVAQRRLVINHFNASTTTIESPNQRVTLSWQVSGSNKVRIVDDAGQFIVNGGRQYGSVVVSPRSSTQYRLVIHNDLGQMNRALRIHLGQQSPKRRWINNAQLQPALTSIKNPIPSSIREDSDGNSYVGTLDRHFYKVDKTGRVEWVFRNIGMVSNPATPIDKDWLLGIQISNQSISEPSEYCRAASSLALLKGGLVVRLGTDKTERWAFATRYPVIAPPSVDEKSGAVIVADYCGVIYELQPHTGQLLTLNDQALNHHQIAQPLLVKDGKLFVKSEDNHELSLQYHATHQYIDQHVINPKNANKKAKPERSAHSIQLLWDSQIMQQQGEAL